MLQKGVFSTDMTESFESALTKSTREVFLEGVHDGMPIALGYFVVSFTLASPPAMRDSTRCRLPRQLLQQRLGR